jgi:hypothetical protein
VKDLQKRADGLLDALLITSLDCLAQPNALADLLVPIRVLELIVEGFGQVIGDESVIAGQELVNRPGF